MKISLSWLHDYLKTDQTAEQLAETLTRSGIEVKSIASSGASIPKVVAAQILESVQHPDADRLSVCKVDDGSGTPRQIVCGAKNYKVGDKILLALPGAVLPGNFKIKVGKLRGVESEGMMCSSKELGLGVGAEGLHILPAETAIGTELSALFPTDTILELEVTPNRPDWLGHVGVAREAAAFGAGEFLWKKLAMPALKIESSIADIQAPNDCSFYSLRTISNIAVKASPSWLQQRLEAIGLRSINNIVDIANYVMMDLAQPLHAFDAAKIKGALVVRFAKEGEKLEALDGKIYNLSNADLVIADDHGPQALAGVIGGMASSVTETTTSLLLESAVFNSSAIRRTARVHGVVTDAAYRFERGTHSAIAQEASAYATSLITELAGGIASQELFTAGSLPEPVIIPFRADRCRQLLGISLSDEEMASLLKTLGLIPHEGGWLVPSWRLDLAREVDLIEEIARLYGIETITPRCMAFPAPSSKADAYYDKAMAVRRSLAAHGFHEARTSTLVAPEEGSEAKTLFLRNPMGAQQSALRTTLIPGLLTALEHNVRQGASSIRFFEVGKVFQAFNEDYHHHSLQHHAEESLSLGIVMAGAALPLEWRAGEQRSLDLYDLKGVLDSLMSEKISYRSIDKKGFPLALEILCEGKACGFLGLLAPAKARQLMVTGQQYPIVIAEVNLSLLQEHYCTVSWKKGADLPKFPAVTRDLALIVNDSVAYELIEKNLLELKEEHLSSVIPFDVFNDPTGEKVPLGKKSIAIALTFQHDDRTLTAEEVSQALKRMMTQLKESLDIEVRS